MSLRIREVKNVRSPGMFTNRFDGQAAVAQVLPGFFGAFNLQRQRHTRTPATLNRRLAFIRNTYVGRFRQLKFYKPSGVMGDWQPQTIFVEIDDFRLHDLRHSFATRLTQSDVDLYKISKLLGHKDIKMTQRYAHHCPDSLREGVEVLDVDYNLTTVEENEIGVSS